jgi:iron complex outermembrane receptor protein
MDGYVKGVTRDLDIFNRDTSYIRTTLKVAPTDRFEAELRYSYWRDKGTGAGAFGYRVGGVFVNPVTNGFDINGQPRAVLYDLPRTGLPGLTGTPINPDPLFYAGDTRLEQDLQQHAVSLNMSVDLGKVVLRSITGFVDYQVFRNADNDFSQRAGNVDGQEDQLTALSQEIQLGSNDKGSRLDWLVGYFFFEEDVKASFFSSCPTAARNTPGCAFAAGLPRTTSHAVFGQASYWLIEDRLRVTGGVRYTHDSKEITRANATTDARQRLVTVQPTGQEFTLNFEKVTWRANLDYQFSRNNMLYASVSTGFRSGGFNAGFFANPLLPGGFGPEDVTAYEIGSKNRFADGKVQLNLSAYRNEFRNLQVQNQFLIQGASGVTTTSVILNAASAHSMGVEAELQWVPVENLNIAMSGTLMEAKYDSYRNVPAPANYTGLLDYTGNDIPYSPTWKLTGLVSYDFDLGGAGKLTPQATLVWSDGYFLTDTNTVLDRQDSFAKLDLRLGWRSADDRYSVEGFVNNVTNQIVLQRATFGSRGLNQSFDAPRMFGVRVGARF